MEREGVTDFDLGSLSRLSSPAEQRLFAAADALLLARRTIVVRPKAPPRRSIGMALMEFALFPNTLSPVAALLVVFVSGWLVTGRLTMRGLTDGTRTRSGFAGDRAAESDPQPNFAPSGKDNITDLYDQERLAEERAYEKEVEDAHQIYDGGA